MESQVKNPEKPIKISKIYRQADRIIIVSDNGADETSVTIDSTEAMARAEALFRMAKTAKYPEDKKRLRDLANTLGDLAKEAKNAPRIIL